MRAAGKEPTMRNTITGITDSKTRADKSENNTTDDALREARFLEMAINRPMLKEAPRKTRTHPSKTILIEFSSRSGIHSTTSPSLILDIPSSVHCRSGRNIGGILGCFSPGARADVRVLFPGSSILRAHIARHSFMLVFVASRNCVLKRMVRLIMCTDKASGRSPRALRTSRFEIEAPTACKCVKSS